MTCCTGIPVTAATPGRRLYESSLAPNAAWLKRRVRVADIVVLQDPQTAAMARR